MSTAFVRDRFTWLTYFMLGYYAYMQAALGPMVPFLRQELSLSYTLAGLHLSGFALGMFLAGLTGDRVAHQIGRPLTYWGGGAGMGLAGLMLAGGRSPLITISATFLMGWLGSYLLVMVQATLSDRHGSLRTYALTESNVIAVLAAGFAPFLIGLGQASGTGWRIALVAGVGAWMMSTVVGRHVALPVSGGSLTHGTAVARGNRLPAAFWAYVLVVFISVSIEWCMIFWAAEFLERVAGLSREVAATTVSLFFIAQFMGRFSGSLLTRRVPAEQLLLGACLVVLIGFPLFWLSQAPLLNVIGLFVCGLGVANLFPLTLSAAAALLPAEANRASARISQSSGLAILVTPQIMGGVADQIGIQGAYGVLAPLVVSVLVVVWMARQRLQRPA